MESILSEVTDYNSCYVCYKSLPPREEESIKVHRKRQCKKCIQKASRERAQKEPIKSLHTKLSSSQYKRPTLPKKEISKETVKMVYERCGKKCVLSGERDHRLLCISSKSGDSKNIDDLVLISTKEAHRISRFEKEEREKLFQDQ